MEPGKLSLAKQAMKGVAHLVEECRQSIMSDQGRVVPDRFGKVRDHGGDRVGTFSIGQFAASRKTPDICMGVFVIYVRTG